MIIKLAFIDYAALGALGFIHGSSTPKLHKTKHEMSYAKGGLLGAGIYGALPSVIGAAAGASLPEARTGKQKALAALAGAAIGGALPAAYGAGAGMTAILGTRLGRKAATNEDTKSFKKMK